MSSILNKSNHPVTVKKIYISVWTLRDEIEAAIEAKIKKNNNQIDSLDISDIQEYYTKDHHQNNDSEESGDDNLDTSGNPMDDDAMAMMQALQGDDDESGDEENTEQDNATEENSESEESEAEKMAREMLEGQGGAPVPEETEAEKMAREMLEGQGATPTSADNSDNQEESKETSASSFNRTYPDEKKHNTGFVFLSDINMEQALVFTRETYTTGSNIVIKFKIPRPFTLTAEVVGSFSVNRNSRVISESKPNYRLQCALKFTFPGERTLMRDFLKSIEPDIPPPPSKLKKPAGGEEEDEDEFDDLGF